MSEANHTPLPWGAFTEELAEGEPLRHILARVSTGGRPAWGELGEAYSAADAQFIVQAVNSHARLLAACKASRKILGYLADTGTRGLVTMLAELDAAIAAAERQGGQA